MRKRSVGMARRSRTTPSCIVLRPSRLPAAERRTKGYHIKPSLGAEDVEDVEEVDFVHSIILSALELPLVPVKDSFCRRSHQILYGRYRLQIFLKPV